jgi:hypothetical protein
MASDELLIHIDARTQAQALCAVVRGRIGTLAAKTLGGDATVTEQDLVDMDVATNRAVASVGRSYAGEDEVIRAKDAFIDAYNAWRENMTVDDLQRLHHEWQEMCTLLVTSG